MKTLDFFLNCWNVLELIINCLVIPGCGWIFLKLGLKNKDLAHTTNVNVTNLEKVEKTLKNTEKTFERKLKKLEEFKKTTQRKIIGLQQRGKRKTKKLKI